MSLDTKHVFSLRSLTPNQTPMGCWSLTSPLITPSVQLKASSQPNVHVYGLLVS